MYSVWHSRGNADAFSSGIMKTQIRTQGSSRGFTADENWNGLFYFEHLKSEKAEARYTLTSITTAQLH